VTPVSNAVLDSAVVLFSALGCTTLSVQNSCSKYCTELSACGVFTVAVNLPLPPT